MCSKQYNRLDDNEDKEESIPNKIKKTSNALPIALTIKQLLSPSFDDSIIGRDSECERIKKWVGSCLKNRRAAVLYISGSAGTGKTLSVTHVLNQMKRRFDFKLITINCMDFPKSKSIYSKILSEIKDEEQTNDLLIDPKYNQMNVL